jgi:flagellar biosynthesis/type III secretory pathway chaperone
MNIEEIKQKALNGEISPIQLLSKLSELEKAVKEAKDEIMEDAISEFEKYGAKSIREYGFEISIAQSGRYDYSDNADWNKKQSEIKEIERRMQAAYKANGSILDENTGEIIEPAIYKSNKPGLKFKKL